jgi:V8-like Glu-specific endopeptidase
MTSGAVVLKYGLLATAAASACSGPAELSVERQAVVGGALDPDSPAVVAIVPVVPTCGEPAGAAPVICTGTLIAPRVVLTAAHCVESADAAQVLSVVFAPDVAQALPDQRVRVIDGRLHPDWNPGQHDVAVVVLAEVAPVPPLVLPLPIDGSTLPPDAVGQTVRVVGFGIDDQAELGRRRSGLAQVTAVEPDRFSIAAAPAMSCGGDSGGPVFLTSGGIERMVGITSFGDAACTTGVNMRLDAHAGFVQAVVDETAQTSPSRPALDPAQDACAARCERHADCPIGMACVARPDGPRSCAVAGFEAGRFAAPCTGPESAHPCIRTGETCRLWLPCDPPAAGGCAVAGRAGSPGLRGAAALVVAAVAAVRRRRWRARARR